MKIQVLAAAVLFALSCVQSEAASSFYYSNSFSPVSGTLSSVSVSATNFVAVGPGSTVIRSDVGAQTNLWTSDIFTPAGVPLRAITYGNNIFLAGATDSRVFSSSDATTWTARGSAFKTTV